MRTTKGRGSSCPSSVVHEEKVFDTQDQCPFAAHELLYVAIPTPLNTELGEGGDPWNSIYGSISFVGGLCCRSCYCVLPFLPQANLKSDHWDAA